MSVNSEAIRVVIADDEPGMRMIMRKMIEKAEGFTLCGEADNGPDLLKLVERYKPQVCFLDVEMPGMTGLELQDLLDSKGFRIPVIFVTGHGDVDMAVHVLKQGAADFLQKPVDGDRLIAVVEAAVKRDLERVETDERDNADRAAFETLTAREKEVVKLVAEGLQNKEIAEKLNIAEKTVKVHRGSATRKLNVRNGVDIATLLRRIGVME